MDFACLPGGWLAVVAVMPDATEIQPTHAATVQVRVTPEFLAQAAAQRLAPETLAEIACQHVAYIDPEELVIVTDAPLDHR